MEEEKVNPLYKKGFEIGYWLKRGDNPHLKEIIHLNANGNKYHEGLLAGQKEAQREQFKEKMAKQQDGKGRDKDQGIDM